MEPKKEEGKNGLLFEKIVEQSPTPILVTDAKGNIVYVNERFMALTGYRPEEIVGKNPKVLSAGKTPRKVYEKLWDTIRSGGVWSGDLFDKRKNGENFWESISISPIKNGSGEITHFIGVWQDTTERRHREEELERDSQTDVLTGVANRRHILAQLEIEAERAARYGRPLAGMMIDVDDLKTVNDRWGHPVGDRVLRTFARIVGKSIRKVDTMGRYGGDEFFILLPEATLAKARIVAERIQKNLRSYELNVLGDLVALTASIGLLSFEDLKSLYPSLLIEKLDQALLHAKQAGKNTIASE